MIINQLHGLDPKPRKERMLHRLTHRYPFLRRRFQHLHNQISRQRSHRFEQLLQLRHSLLLYQLQLTNHLMRLPPFLLRISTNIHNPVKLINIRTTTKDLLPQVKLNYQRPQSEDIYFLVILQVQYDLQRPIPSRNHVICIYWQVIHLGETEIDQLYVKCFRVNQNILRLDIPVHDAFLMQEFQRITQLKCDISNLLIIQIPLPRLLHTLVIRYQIHRHVFEHKVSESIDREAFVQLNDVGMVDAFV